MLSRSLKKHLILFTLLLVLPIIVAEEEPANAFFTFADAVSKEPISDVFVRIDFDGTITNYFLEKDSTLKLRLEGGERRMKVLINNPATKGYDYYGETSLDAEISPVKVVYLYPVGSLSGFVKDNLDQVIAEAELSFDCGKGLNINFPNKADKFGYFYLDYVMVGNCKVYGSYRGSLGAEEITIKHGEKNFVDIRLDNVLILPNNRSYFPWTIVILAVILSAASGLLYYLKRKTAVLEREEKKEEREVKKLKEEIKEIKNLDDLSKREKDIFKTLRDNEKKVVEFLIGQKEPVYFSKIHYKTGLSKGSLFRNVRSLEKKNIVKTTKEGKVRKIQLSDWFLGH